MPLKEGTTDAVISDNIAELIRAGYSREQAAAIAYKKAGRSKNADAAPAAGTPVAPAWNLCRMDGIASFKAGVWNGVPHDDNFVKTLADNFRRYSSGPAPYYRPYVSLNHKDELRCGYVDSAGVDATGTLRLSADGIPEPVAAWRNAGGLVQPSIEYFEPVYENGKLVDGFRCPDGSISPTPVLKCLTLLGNNAPAVKGLPDLPVATYSTAQPQRQFSASPKCVRRFANASNQGLTMDRNAILQALQALGIDTSAVTDAVPDEVLKAWLDSIQKLSNAPAAGATAPDANTPNPGTQTMADAGAGLGAVGAGSPAPLASLPAVGGQQPSAITLKFADNTPAAIAAGLAPALQAIQAQANATIAAIQQDTQRQLATLNQSAHQQAYAAKFADVTNFVNQLATPDANRMVRIQPAQKPGLVELLMKCDNTRVQKFADGASPETELARQKRIQLATLPKIRLGEKLQDPAPGSPGGRGAGGGMDPDRRERMLKATPQGRKILEAEKAK